MGAWIETVIIIWNILKSLVAPYVGAWIETVLQDQQAELAKSHPTWVRGLKPAFSVVHLPDIQSHPTWVRGLKQFNHYDIKKQKEVAPYVGAWIETGKPLMPPSVLCRTLRGCVD